MFFVVVGTEEGVMAWVIVVAMVVLVATFLWHPCTMDSGKQTLLSLSKALFSGHGFLMALLPPPTVHSK